MPKCPCSPRAHRPVSQRERRAGWYPPTSAPTPEHHRTHPGDQPPAPPPGDPSCCNSTTGVQLTPQVQRSPEQRKGGQSPTLTNHSTPPKPRGTSTAFSSTEFSKGQKLISLKQFPSLPAQKRREKAIQSGPKIENFEPQNFWYFRLQLWVYCFILLGFVQNMSILIISLGTLMDRIP